MGEGHVVLIVAVVEAVVGGRGDSSSNNCSLSLSVTPSMSESGAAVVEVIGHCAGEIYARQRDIDVCNLCSMGAQLPYTSLITY